MKPFGITYRSWLMAGASIDTIRFRMAHFFMEDLNKGMAS